MTDTDIYTQCSVCRHWVPKPIESHHSEQDCEINLEAERSALAITTKENSMTDTPTTETEIRASENEPATPVATTEKVEPQLTREQKISKARNAATSTLIDSHREEFNALMVANAAELGVEWTPKKSAAEKAKEEIEATLAAHPELREVLRKQLIREASGATATGVDLPPSA